MGSKILSSDMLVSTYLFPAIAAYGRKDYQQACVLLYSFNEFFKTFGEAIDDLPPAKDPSMSDVRDRVNPQLYYCNYFEMYLPVLSKVLGKYQRVELDLVKEEHGRY
jgi:hypothetical protein